MDKQITPEQVEQAAVKARLPLSRFLANAQVSRGSFYKWRKGGIVRPLTLGKLADAVEAAGL